MLVAAATSLAHIQSNLIFRSVGGSQVKVGGEHTGGHVAQLAANDIPGTGIQLFLHPVPCKLHDTTGHVLPLIAGVAGDAAQPAGLFAQLGNIKGFVKGCVYIVFLLLRGTCNCHVHHVGNVTDGFGTFFPAGLEDTHDLKEVGGHGSNLTIQLPIGFLFCNELAPGGGKAFSGIQFFLQHGIPPISFCCKLIIEKTSL